MLITISGQSGSGKSSTAQGLAKALRMPTVDVGQIFRGMAEKYGMTVGAFGLYAEKHRDVDEKLDQEMLKLARRRKKLILQGRLTGWMTFRHKVPAVRIWIGASLAVRARRVSGREGIPYRKAYQMIAKRDRDNVVRYKATYGLDLNDLSVYDVVVQTDDLTVAQVVDSLVNSLKLWPKKSPRRKAQPKKRQPPKRRARQ